MIESAIYTGTLHHTRLEGPSHAFSYNVAMAWLAVEELPGALDAHPLWSARRPAPMRFRRQDFHGPPGVPLGDAVRHTVAEATGRLPTGPVRLLAHLRTWGWSFNPIAFYFVMTADGQSVDTLVAEVTNTPSHERHAYVIPVDAPALATPRRFPKRLHVSPFMDLDLDHSLAFSAPGAPEMTIRMDDWRGDDKTFAATLRLDRQPLDRPTMGSVLRQHPLPAQRVSAGIYLEALKLRFAGAPFRRHPAKGDHTAASLAPSKVAGCPVDHLSASPLPSPSPRTLRSTP